MPLAPPGRLAGRGERRRRVGGPRAVTPHSAAGPRDGELPRPTRPEAERKVLFPALYPIPSVLPAPCLPARQRTGPGCEGSPGFIGAGLKEGSGCRSGKVFIPSTGDFCFGGMVGSREFKASLPGLECAEGEVDRLAAIS